MGWRAEIARRLDQGRSCERFEALSWSVCVVSAASGATGPEVLALVADALRARLNVTRAIRLALTRIAEHHPELGKHLELAVRTGTYCAYEPDPGLPVSWSV